MIIYVPFSWYIIFPLPFKFELWLVFPFPFFLRFRGRFIHEINSEFILAIFAQYCFVGVQGLAPFHIKFLVPLASFCRLLLSALPSILRKIFQDEKTRNVKKFCPVAITSLSFSLTEHAVNNMAGTSSIATLPLIVLFLPKKSGII